MRVGSYISER